MEQKVRDRGSTEGYKAIEGISSDKRERETGGDADRKWTKAGSEHE